MSRSTLIRLALESAIALLVAGGVLINASGALAITLHNQTIADNFVVRGQTIPRLSHVKPAGRENPQRVLNLSIALTPRNSDQLSALIAAQNDPGSPLYHQYLTPAEYDASFGPSAGDA